MNRVGLDDSEPDEMRPVERADEPGVWDALDANGYGYTLAYRAADLVEAWLDGYRTGARENM